MSIDSTKTILLIVVALLFSFGIRLLWVYEFNSNPNVKFNNEFMINTNDGYAWAEGARDILAKHHQENDSSHINSAPSILTALLMQVLPLSLETLMFYMPAFFSSLLVIPLILIGKTLDEIEVGFIAALIGSIAWSYYNRTMVGYYDTDFLNVLLPTVLLWSLIYALRTNDEKYLIIAALDSIFYRWWYPQSYSLEFAFIALLCIYLLYQYAKKENLIQTITLISFMLLAIVNLDEWIRFIMVALLYIALKLQENLVKKYIYYIFIASVCIFFVTGGIDPIISKLQGYVFKDTINQINNGLGLHFFTVTQTIREASQIPFETFANRISGHIVIFILAFAGYIFLTIRHRVMLLAIPMIGLGFLAYGIPNLINGAGLRFTVYAVPIMALGAGYAIYYISTFLSKNLLSSQMVNRKYIFMIPLTALALYPNIKHVLEYKVPTVFLTPEVQTLDHLKNVASREDYIVTWWDYGYPIRYYSDVKTLVDGGRHMGSSNFPISFILTHDQQRAAKMARLEVEYTEENFKIKKQNKELEEEQRIKRLQNTAQMITDYGFDDSNDFLTSLHTDIQLPQKTRDIYLYLPNRMMNILPTVTLFSNLNLMSGEKYPQPFFYQTINFQENAKQINLGRGIRFIKDKGMLAIGEKQVPIKNFVVTAYNGNKLTKRMSTLHSNGKLSIIFMKNYKKFLILDEKMYNSTYIQLFALENYDRTLYEPTILTPLVKIYKLKI
jgi:dolichyl-diphosphooligosaccharide--protein glycosyltransferase/undecaprenyl-diphosphooligosaccharide--protein glycosyltransferase